MKKTEKRPTIAFLGDNLCNEYEGPIWFGAVQAAKMLDVNLLGYSGGMLERWYRDKTFNLIDRETIDGIVSISGTLGSLSNDEEIQKFYRHFVPLPIVSISRSVEGTINLLTDNESGMEELMRHLIEEHHYRKIAYIGGPKNNAEAVARFNVYRSSLAQYGLGFDLDRVYYGNFWDGGAEAVQAFLDERKVDFDAIVAANDYMALYAMKELHRRGYRVPEDYAVTGFDDLKDSQNAEPALTTVRQPLIELGRESIKMILSVLRGGDAGDIHLPTSLVTRRSCGCPIEQGPNFAAANVLQSRSNKNAGTAGVAAAGLPRILNEEFSGISVRLGGNNWAETLVKALTGQADGESDGFLRVLEETVEAGRRVGVKPSEWYPVIRSAIEWAASNPVWSQRGVMSMLGCDAAELIGRLNVKSQMARQRWRDEKYSAIQRIYHELNPALDTGRIRLRIAENFTYLDIESFYLSRYMDEERKTAKLFYYHSQNRRVEIDGDDRTFPVERLIPGRFTQNGGQFTFVILPIMHIGYALYEVSGFEPQFPEDIMVQINTAIKLTALMSEVCEYALSLEEKVDERTHQLQNVLHELEVSNLELQDKNAILADLVERDALTGLYNHSAIHMRLGEIMEEHRRLKVPVSVIMLDVDDFKHFNDEHGHLIGDEILVQISDIIKNELHPEYRTRAMEERLKCELRKYDVAGRYGGDEFVVVLPYCGEEDIIKVVERLCKRARTIRLAKVPGNGVSVSIGAAVIPGDAVWDQNDAKKLLIMADQALYQAKKEGKDRFFIVKTN